MGKEEFEEFIKQNDTKKEQINWEEKKQLFIEKVDEFYNIIDKYLEPYQIDIAMRDSDITIYEEKLGNYEVKKRTLDIKGNTIEFTPIGTILIGAWGRIDMEGSNGVVKFVLVPENSDSVKIETAILSTDEDRKKWKEKQANEDKKRAEATKIWKVATPAPNIKYLDLDADIFFDKLMEIIDG